MTDIRELADLLAPQGWGVETLAGWPEETVESVREVPTSAGNLPEHSHTKVRSSSVAGVLTLEWVIPEGTDQLHLRKLSIDGTDRPDDLWAALTRMTKARQFDGWRRAAVSSLLMRAAANLVLDEGRGPEALVGNGVDGAWTDDDVAFIGRQMAQFGQFSAPSKRERISQDLLRDVARVYREAHAEGRRPTQAVATHFDKPRSTAGRWVGLARQAGFLGPADGPRAGEVTDG